MLFLHAFWQLTRGARRQFTWAILAMGMASCLLYIPPLIAQTVLDTVLLGREATGLSAFILERLGGDTFVRERLWLPGLVMLGFTVAAGAGTYLRGRWSAQACETVIRSLRDRVYNHLQRLPAPWFDEAETGDIVQRCTSDVDTVQVFLATHIVEIARSLVMFLAPLPFMLAISGRMTAVSVVMIPVITAFSTLFFLRVRSAFTEKDEAEAAMTTVVQENLTGIRVVRAFGRGPFEEARFAEKNTAHRDLDARLYRLMANFWSLSDLLTFVQMVLVLSAGAWLMSTDELGPGAFFYFLTATTMFMYPLRQMGRIVADLGKATVAFSRLQEILDAPEEEADGDAPVEEGAITFEDVHFGYGEAEPTLRGVSLHIPARTTAAIVGASGSGKTTLVSLLLRLYDPTSGTIQIDGTPLDTLGRRALRSKLAVVMQEPFLFSKSIGANLSLGRDTATQEEVERATEAADVHQTITRFDAGYDTEVGERGVTLSGGQRQRVALARALLQNPSILLLDDSLSAVDTHTEAAILQRMERRRGRHTTVIIAHRLSTVAHADQIFMLDAGRVIESGSHASLLAQDGAYARLWALQSGLSHAV